MSCCGKTIKKIENIASGYMNLLTGEKYKFTDRRIRICHSCEENTWLSKGEYAQWLGSNNIKIVLNFTQLEKLPKLAKYERDKARRHLFCRICKCYLPAKARVEDESCPLGLWKRAK